MSEFYTDLCISKPEAAAMYAAVVSVLSDRRALPEHRSALRSVRNKTKRFAQHPRQEALFR